ncbi:PREDICTED: mucin-5AC-like [Papilio polytes]|uniref:mucin-5AC-like n=1 Tax=Papilio polytes TaxID=76194 RepID=UPI0006766BB0|nr:PREDICTED: mucin-5AC-like [Papilio polytes]
MYTVALLTSTLLALVAARIYERCELARDLLQLGVRKDHIATWVCIAYHESRFDTAARNPSSGDHGLLQISEIYWCGAGKACGLPCSALRDDDISDDVECALSIYEEHTRIQGNGFLAWVVYPHYCKHNAKKYLADCDHSAKDSSYKFEDRGRTFTYDSYPNINFTLSNPVKSEFSYSQSDRSVPSFLSIASLLRGKYEQDFERDYNKNKRVNWVQFKVDNVDDLILPDFNRRPNFLEPRTRISTTSTTTTTMEPEPQYKPVKPWRTIESNQFRRRMMKFNNTPLEEIKNKTMNDNSLVTTTLKLFTSTESTTHSSASTNRMLHDNYNSITSNACCSTVAQSSQASSSSTQRPRSYFSTKNTVTSVTTQKPAIFLTTQKPAITSTTQKPAITFTTWKPAFSFTTQKSPITLTTQKPATSLSFPITQQYYGGLTSPEQFPKKLSVVTENRAKSFWDTFGYLTTQSPKLKPVSYTTKSLETTTVKPYKPTQLNLQQNASSRESPTQGYNSVNLNRIATTERTKEKFTATPTLKQFPVTRPTAFTWRTTKSWNVRQPQYTQRYNPITTYVSEYKTERPFSWRRGKSWANDNQNGTYFSTETPTTTTSHYNTTEIPSTTSRQHNNQSVYQLTNGLSSTTTSSLSSSTSTTSSTLSKKKQELTEGFASTSPATTKSSFSIFDIYLNPAKRQQVPNFKVLFSDNSASNFKIFSGGTTSAPLNRSISKKS